MMYNNNNMKFRNKSITQITFLVFFMSIIFVSCVSQRNIQLVDTDILVDSQNYESAYNELKSYKEKIYKQERDDILYGLDAGMLALHAKDTGNAIDQLTTADLLMDELRKKDVAEQIGASILNDSVITYNGYNHEYVFTSIMLSLGYLQEKDFDAGFVEIRRAQNKLQKIQVDNDILLTEYNKNTNESESHIAVDPIKLPFVDSAFTRLMSFWLYRADYDFTNMEVAARKYDEAIVAQPDLYAFTPPKITEDQFTTEGRRVQVVSFTSKAPILYSKTFSLNTVENGIVVYAIDESDLFSSKLTSLSNDEWISDIGSVYIPGMPGGLTVSFSVPEIAVYDPKVDSIEVWHGDNILGNLTLTEDLENISVKMFLEETKLIYARQISRVILKAIAGVATSQVHPLLGLVTQVATNLSEQADIRMARYFPAKIWSGDFALPQSENPEYNLTIKYIKNESIVYENIVTTSITQENDVFNILIDAYL